MKQYLRRERGCEPPPYPMTGPRHHVRVSCWKSAAIHCSEATFLGKLVEIKKTIRADSMLAGCVCMLLDIDFDSFPIPLIVFTRAIEAPSSSKILVRS